MLGSAILDIAIGLVFVYLILSLVVTASSEVIVSWLRWRAKNLHDGIGELLRDPKDQQGWAAKLYAHPLIDALSLGPTKPSYIPSRTFAIALLDIIAPAKPDGSRTSQEVRTAIAELPPELRRTVTVLFDEAEHDIEKLKTGFEIWFNGSMERVSGWYKRRSQFVILGLAALVTVAYNVDTLSLVRSLSNDAALRASLVAKAQAEVKEPLNEEGQNGSVQADAKLENSIAALNDLGLPLGWDGAEYQCETPTATILLWGRRLCGWVLTAFAISLGAPFWFDLLNRFMNVRGAGKAPEDKPKKPKTILVPAAPGAPNPNGPADGDQ